jgi:hypothetical protein
MKLVCDVVKDSLRSAPMLHCNFWALPIDGCRVRNWIPLVVKTMDLNKSFLNTIIKIVLPLSSMDVVLDPSLTPLLC